MQVTIVSGKSEVSKYDTHSFSVDVVIREATLYQKASILWHRAIEFVGSNHLYWVLFFWYAAPNLLLVILQSIPLLFKEPLTFPGGASMYISYAYMRIIVWFVRLGIDPAEIRVEGSTKNTGKDWLDDWDKNLEGCPEWYKRWRAGGTP